MITSGTILNTLSEPVLLLDDGLCALMANPAFCHMLDVAPQQLKGKSLDELLSGREGAQQLMKVLEPCVTNGFNVENEEVTLALPNRPQVFLSVSARCVPKEKASHTMFIVELHNVTKERTAELKVQELNEVLERHVASLEITNKELEAFSHSVSHDLRVPLRLMNKVAHLLLDKQGGTRTDDAREIVKMIISGTEEMESLVETLLTFSRVISSPLKKRHVNLQRLACEVAKKLEHEQQGRVVEFEIEALPPCRVDRKLLKEVFANLLGNSLKFTRVRETARIRIGYKETAEETVYFVQDNGVGFDMAQSESLFMAFHKLHKPSDYKGSGIGLSLVRRIIERHGGRIWGKGEIDNGATFYFTLSGRMAAEAYATKIKVSSE